MRISKLSCLLSVCLALLLLAVSVSCTPADDPADETQPDSSGATAEVTDAAANTPDATEAPTELPTEEPTEATTEPETEPLPAYTELDYCHFNYECVRSVNEVTADGIYHEDEWKEAKELVIDAETLQDWGRWQAGPAMDISDLSVTFRIKWDEEYLYLLEIRIDSKYVHEFGTKSYDVFSQVWGGDGTAFFFCDAAYDVRENRFDIGYFTYVKELGGPAVYIGTFDGDPNAFHGPSGTNGCIYGGTYDEISHAAIFEIKVPWALMEEQGKLLTDIEPGALFRFNPIIPSVDTQAGLGMYDAEWRQINFHDCVDNGEGGDPDDPYYWAALTLVEK